MNLIRVFAYTTLILGNFLILESCTTKTKEVPSNWFGICGDSNQPGTPITLTFNQNISSLNDALFAGNCGALGTPCAVVADTTDVTDDHYSEIRVNVYSDANCSTLSDASNIYFVANAFSTIATLTELTCTAGQSFQIIWSIDGEVLNSFLIATSSPNPTAPPAATVSTCTIPDSFVDLSSGEIPITACIPC